MSLIKPPYYNSMEEQQSTAIENSDEVEQPQLMMGSLAFSNILYTIPTGWAWNRSSKVILNSVRFVAWCCG